MTADKQLANAAEAGAKPDATPACAFTTEPLRRVIRQAGASRVSDDAARALARALETRAAAIVAEAAKVASHANRQTVLAEDVKLARKIVETVGA
ncbi:MAG: NFYB/HAP3 family transcription factor subunit [Candidatus Aenigmatarchaeota archaeon]